MSAAPSLDIRALDRARISRDPRFDGKFFIAVTSTRIYCRPICPVRSPKPANIRYYFSAAAAAEAGYRPCLRCRPEAAPGTPAWQGTSAVVKRALRLIEEGILDSASVNELAGKVGVGPRHLHRLFLQHVGASPIVLAQTRRLHFAKRLLDETSLPITEIALAAGFGSVRRFNSVFRQTYKRAPRDLRRQTGTAPVLHPTDEVTLKLAFRPPYDFARLLAFLRDGAIRGVEVVDASSYSRTVSVGNGDAIVRVSLVSDANALELRVRGADPSDLFSTSAAVRRTFDISADPAQVAQALQSDRLLGPLVARSPGLRIPGAWDPFECSVRAILGERIGRGGAHTVITRLVESLGMPIKNPLPGLTTLFPTPRQIAESNLRDVGLSKGRIEILKRFALAVVAHRIDFGTPLDEIIAALTKETGAQNWIAQYVALRSLGEPDAFPAADPILRRIVAKNMRAVSEAELASRSQAWRPWRAYAAMYLWDSDRLDRVRGNVRCEAACWPGPGEAAVDNAFCS
jgi:AraC family transcriptional regulator, regulatory protein of adaptative response / DNA-3-methyladenine glycosylase II